MAGAFVATAGAISRTIPDDFPDDFHANPDDFRTISRIMYRTIFRTTSPDDFPGDFPDDFPDEIDTASSEVSLQFTGRLREREQGLLAKIEAALRKIDDGGYGACLSCGEDIGVKRIQARPMAQLCIDCKGEQEQLERREG